jgi:hypothetical protein
LEKTGQLDLIGLSACLCSVDSSRSILYFPPLHQANLHRQSEVSRAGPVPSHLKPNVVERLTTLMASTYRMAKYMENGLLGILSLHTE